MIREEAKKKLWSNGKLNTLAKVECDEILNQVYDDFESREMAPEDDFKTKDEWYKIGKQDATNDFESRTCENCKYWSQEKEFPRYCELLDVDIDDYHNDFGCNKFEAKEDSK